jgi:hypothetical protein
MFVASFRAAADARWPTFPKGTESSEMQQCSAVFLIVCDPIVRGASRVDHQAPAVETNRPDTGGQDAKSPPLRLCRARPNQKF